MMRSLLIITGTLLWLQDVYSQALVASYPFDKGSVADVSGNNNHGVISGGVSTTADRFGNPCGALAFNGIDGYIEVANSVSLQSVSTSFSVACWFKLNSAWVGDKWLTLICKGDNPVETDANPQYRVQTFQSFQQSTVSVNTDFTEYDDQFATHPFEYDKWHQYVLVYNGAMVMAYLNGGKIWEFAYSRPLGANSSPLYIGRDIPGNDEFYAGCMDDLKIYSTALSADQVRQLYAEKRGNVSYDEFTLSAPWNRTAIARKGDCYAVVDYKPPILTSSCGSASVKQIGGLPSGSKFPMGVSPVIYEATGPSGFKKTWYSKITVLDQELPVINCARDTVLWATDETGIKKGYYFNMPPATDNCSFADVVQEKGPSSGSFFPIGQTALRFAAVDRSGNRSTCGYMVTVLRKEPPRPVIEDSITHAFDVVLRKPTVTLVMYDHAIEDADTISVFLNGTVIVDQERIRLKKKQSIIRTVTMKAGEENLLVVKAWNIGTVSPNTLTIEFYEGNFNFQELQGRNPDLVKRVDSKPGIGASISLQYKVQ